MCLHKSPQHECQCYIIKKRGIELAWVDNSPKCLVKIFFLYIAANLECVFSVLFQTDCAITLSRVFAK